MVKLNKDTEVYNGEYRLSSWVRLYNEGHFNSYSRAVQTDCGWFDWFCNTDSLYTRLKKLAPKVIEVAESGVVDSKNHYVFFKNVCPLIGPTYDSFRICDIESGKVMLCFSHLNKGSHNCKSAHWELDDFRNGHTLISGTWRDIRKYLGY